MTLFEYNVAKHMPPTYPFESLIMRALMDTKPDIKQWQILKNAFPEIWDEVAQRSRYKTGILPTE